MAPLEANYDDSINNSRDKVEDPKWGKLFPTCVADRNNSATFLGRSIYVAFSVVLNRRGILAQQYFTKNYITENLKCMTLSFKEPALPMVQQMKAAAEAIKLGYLKEFSLVLTANENEDEAIEVYTFKFHYHENGSVSAEMKTKADQSKEDEPLKLEYKGSPNVRDQLVLMVRSIGYLCKKVLKDLPEVYFANFRVHYTEDTPADYKMEGFENSMTYYTLPDDTQMAVIGHVRPGYHLGTISCSSICIEDSYAAELNLKRFADKLTDVMGLQKNETLYLTMETADHSTFQPDPTETISDAVPQENENNTMDAITDRLGSSVVVGTPKENYESPKAEKKTSRRAAAAKSSPYKKRSRK